MNSNTVQIQARKNTKIPLTNLKQICYGYTGQAIDPLSDRELQTTAKTASQPKSWLFLCLLTGIFLQFSSGVRRDKAGNRTNNPILFSGFVAPDTLSQEAQ